MISPKNLIENAVAQAGRALLQEKFVPGDLVKPCGDLRHGDYQTNAAMVHGKTLSRNPRELASEWVIALGESEVFDTPEIAGPGFINFRLRREFCEKNLCSLIHDPRCGVELVAAPKRIALDFSGPNIAKEMHVGHIRSTILGDALARIWRFLGHHVITDNHLGDWGTQFGKIIVGFKRSGDRARLTSEPVAYLEELYQEVHEASKTDETIQEQARAELVKLQQGDPENRRLWQEFVDYSLVELNKIYARLGVRFDHTLGESFYNEELERVVNDLQTRGIARASEGAICVFFEGEKTLEDKPFLIQKSDEGYLYATTDLATLDYRVKEWQADQIVYVTDGRQQLHFQQLFTTARRWGLKVGLDHVWFGAILGEDKKPLKTREGKPIKLRQLLDEAEERALAIITEKRPELPEPQRHEIARVVGLGALKYADLGQNRNLDYVFSWQKLLAFDGNTAPYLQNAYVRIRSILRKVSGTTTSSADIKLTENEEVMLAKKILSFSDTLAAVLVEQRPHLLCVYLYELATGFHQFYEHCPVLKAEDGVRESRLALCMIVAQVLRTGLDLLGIEVVEEM